MYPETGAPLLNDQNIQIGWNAGSELFKEELAALHLSCHEDLKGSWQLYKGKFLLAKQHTQQLRNLELINPKMEVK